MGTGELGELVSLKGVGIGISPVPNKLFQPSYFFADFGKGSPYRYKICAQFPPVPQGNWGAGEKGELASSLHLVY